jgi:hypothetical protein
MGFSKGEIRHGRRAVPVYARISFAAFLCCLVLLILFIANAKSLSGLGLTDHVYYLILVLMGLTATVFLFGVIPSSATFEGKFLGGTLRLGGAVVGAALVVVGGYYFIPRGFTFPLTVYVHGRGGPSDIVLRSSGHVAIQLGPEVQRELVGENGQAYFPAIPANFRGQEVPVWIESDEYEVADAEKNQPLEGPALTLTVKEKISSYKIAGIISDKAGDGMAEVRVSLPDYNAESITNKDGHYELEVTDTNQRITTLVAQKTGYKTARLNPTLGDSGFNFSLERGR